MYNLHIYIEKITILHVVTYKWKYINIVNSSDLFLSELEEMKSCLYRVETANAWDEIIVVLVSSACTAAWGNWVDRKSLQKTIFDKSLQSLSNAHPAYYWVAYL